MSQAALHARAVEQVFALRRLGRGRLAAMILRLRGARVGSKSIIGARLLVLRPWGLHLGERCTLEDDVFFKIVDDGAQVTIGDSVFIGRGVELDVQRAVDIGEHTVIAPGVFIVDHDHGLCARQRIDQQPCRASAVTIGRDVWVGANAVILAGVRIGDGAVIGAGAVVTRDVPPLAVAVGVPARALRLRSGAPAAAGPPC